MLNYNGLAVLQTVDGNTREVTMSVSNGSCLLDRNHRIDITFNDAGTMHIEHKDRNFFKWSTTSAYDRDINITLADRELAGFLVKAFPDGMERGELKSAALELARPSSGCPIDKNGRILVSPPWPGHHRK